MISNKLSGLFPVLLYYFTRIKIVILKFRQMLVISNLERRRRRGRSSPGISEIIGAPYRW